MNLFRRRGIYYVRVARRDGHALRRSLDTADLATARKIARALDVLADQRQWWALDAILDRRTTAAKVYDHHVRGALDALRAELADVDLAPLAAEWKEWMAGRGVPAAKQQVQYGRQLDRWMPTPKRRSDFTRAALSAYLATIPGARNRHHAALSSFGAFLVERGVLETNPLRDVARAKEAPPRTLYLDVDEAQKVLDVITDPVVRRAHVLMAASGMEVSAILTLRAADVAVGRTGWQARAKGTKTAHRDRTVEIVDWWGAWALLVRFTNASLPGALLCPGLNADQLRRPLQAAAAAVGFPGLRTHDWRHTFAVRARREGRPDYWIAHQLGHRDTTMVARVYGRFVPQPSPSASHEAASMPQNATPAKEANR